MKSCKCVVGSILALVVLAFSPVGTALAQVKVTSATPFSTYQGTLSLDVVIAGSGFDNTSKAQFFISGSTNPGGITVKKTVFHNSKEVVATIDVADTATVASFDVVVMLNSGRKGKGTGLFAVQSKTNDPCAAAVGFPAFVFRRVTSTSTAYIADRTGQCVRKLIDNVNTFNAAFTYPVLDDLGMPTNRGRIVWAGALTTDLYGKYYAMDFAVIGTNVVPGTPYLVADLGLNAESGGRHSCCGLDLGIDGHDIFMPVVDSLPDGYVESIVRLRLPTNLADLPGQMPLTETTVIRHRPRQSASSFLGALITSSMRVNAAGDLLYAELTEYDMDGKSHHRLVRIDLDADLVDTDGRPEVALLRDPVRGAGSAVDMSSLSSDFVATIDSPTPTTGCSTLVLLNGRTGTILNEGTAWPAINVAWAAGKLLSRGVRSGCRSLDTIVEIDPWTGSTKTLVTGEGAEGR